MEIVSYYLLVMNQRYCNFIGNSLAFTDSTPVGVKSSPHVNIDTLLRSGMYDFLIVDKLFQIMFNRHFKVSLD